MLKVFVLSLLFTTTAFGQVIFPPLPQPITSFSFEDKDWAIEATKNLRKSNYHGSTPNSIPGGRVIKTLELKALLESGNKPVVIDVLGGKNRKTIPGAYWMSGAGEGNFYGAEKTRFAASLEKLSGGQKSKPIVFLCLSSECWLSYNAALYAIEAGYKDVIWYRGGTNSWSGASLDVKEPESVNW